MDEIENLHTEMRSCSRCRLRNTCKQVVPGEGRVDTSMVLLGEGPGQEEDEQGRPFIGRSGSLLREYLRLVGINTHEVYISNVVRCRPPDNRLPNPDEIEACWPWTQKTLTLIRPVIIVTLGKTPLVTLAQKLGFPKKVGQDSITKLAGVPIYLEQHGMYIYPTFHPAYVCRRADIRRDFEGQLRYLREAYPMWIKRPGVSNATSK